MKKRFLALSIAVGLVGCGGGGKSSNSKPGASIPPTGNFTAYNGFRVVKSGEVINVDLHNYVEGGSSIVSLTSDNANCSTPEMEQMSFSVKFDTSNKTTVSANTVKAERHAIQLSESASHSYPVRKLHHTLANHPLKSWNKLFNF